ncbi:MAG: ZIP family metal transporter [Chloroflexota bacterium]|nr:ZIP family metal transporter [Chloroflexota bacterium]
MTFIEQFSPIVQALIGTTFTWGVTALGAALVFFTKEVSRKLLNGMLGFASGVMIAASFFSLLAPAIEMSHNLSVPVWVPAVAGFILGGVFLFLTDKLLPHLHMGMDISEAEGPKTSWQRSLLLIIAITLHNIPEGLAVGVAFGAAAAGVEGADVASAVALAIGIGIQNFPEGLAVSAPLRREGWKVGKAFLFGQFSGMVEPIAGLIGAAATLMMRPLLPYALSFAAGAMIYVVAEELIPESKSEGHSDIPTIGVMLGFAVMMLLDVALG